MDFKTSIVHLIFCFFGGVWKVSIMFIFIWIQFGPTSKTLSALRLLQLEYIQKKITFAFIMFWVQKVFGEVRKKLHDGCQIGGANPFYLVSQQTFPRLAILVYLLETSSRHLSEIFPQPLKSWSPVLHICPQLPIKLIKRKSSYHRQPCPVKTTFSFATLY